MLFFAEMHMYCQMYSAVCLRCGARRLTNLLLAFGSLTSVTIAALWQVFFSLAAS